jgi:2-(1,2-epoxy-1,2-dihydrophenyl)acetyl-CoA isomerase
MELETIIVRKADGVAVLTLNRPDVLNAMNFQLVNELDRAITDAEEDENVRAVVLTGSGDRAFSAGGDIHEQRRDANELTPEEDQRRRAIRSQHAWHLAACRKPVVGALNGLSYGGGSVLASSLDIRVGCERSKFRFLAAAYGRLNCTWTLPQQVGWPVAKELLFTGRVVEADEAYRIGLLNHLVAPDEVLDKAMEIATTIAENHADSVQGVKQLLVEDVGLPWQEMWQREIDYMDTRVRHVGVEDAFKEFIGRRGR